MDIIDISIKRIWCYVGGQCYFVAYLLNVFGAVLVVNAIAMEFSESHRGHSDKTTIIDKPISFAFCI